MRIVFLGSPEFAVPSLQALVDNDHDVVLVVTQPDRPAGRGRQLRPSAVKGLALERGLPLLQPKSVNSDDSLQAISTVAPEALVIAAFGQLLKQPLLDTPQRGSLNVHASLLPKYRGAAPVAGALLAGEATTGVTIMEVVLALDAGPVVAQRELPMEPQDTTGSLTAKLAGLGAALLVESLSDWARGKIVVRPQDDAQATYVKTLRREDARIEWLRSAGEIWRQVRAFNPWPVAYTQVGAETLRIHEAWPLDADSSEAPGTVVSLADSSGVPAETAFALQTGDGMLSVVRAQRAGRRAVSGAELLRGWRGLIGSRAS